MNCLRKVLSILLCAASSPLAASAQRPDTVAWLEDLAYLQREMAGHYSTFQWQVRERRLDLRRLVAQTRESLWLAADEAAARSVIQRFLAAFADGHLSVSWPTPSRVAPAAPMSLCARLGFDGVRPAAGLDFGSVRGFKAIVSADSAMFPAGVVTVGRRHVGILRIGVFEASPFPVLCDSALAALRLAPQDECDGACENAIDMFTGNMLTEALVRQVQRLVDANVDVIAIDLTRNPGGNDWNEPAARVLTGRRIHGSPYGFIRHPHWVATLERRLRTLRSDTAGLTSAQRSRVDSAAERVEEALIAARKPCDLMPLWENEPVDCALVVDRPFFVTGLLDYATPGELPRRPSSTVLFSPSRYRYQEGEYRGPLWIIIDEGSASSSERFAAMLQDNQAAVVIGVPSLGAGCGYTNGGIPSTLPRSGGRVRMPDCFQFRMDMTSVGDGVTPDVLVPWRARDTSLQRVARILPILETAPIERR